MNMSRPLSVQKKIDTQAIALAVGISFALTLVFSATLAAINLWLFVKSTPPGVDDSIAGGMELIGTFFLSALFLFPLWLWVGFRLRRVVNWPKGAFERTNRVSE
jgi:hypothetical protein